MEQACRQHNICSCCNGVGICEEATTLRVVSKSLAELFFLTIFFVNDANVLVENRIYFYGTSVPTKYAAAAMEWKLLCEEATTRRVVGGSLAELFLFA